MMSEKEINDAINNCKWRNESIPDVPICSGEVLPCSKTIDSGKCPTLKKLFRKDTQDVLLNSERTE